MSLFARTRALWRTLSRSAQLDADMDEEMRFHVQMQADRLMRERGLDAIEARRQALVAFGGVEKFKEHGRDARGLQWLDVIALDARLAGRMLIKYPALTLIGAFAMAVAIAVGATTFEIVSEVLAPPSVIQDGDRLVAIQFATEAQGAPERRVLADFLEWRRGLVTVQQLSAFRTASHNLSTSNESTDAIRVAEVTASTFDVVRVPPLLGRYIQVGDESAGAAPVIVIGHSAWQTRFAGDPAVVGRIVKLGPESYTIVGVMPEGFKFPVDHEYWIPLQTGTLDTSRLQGPGLWVFGRLAPDATIAQAQAELTAAGQRLAAMYPEQYARLRPTVMPFAREHVDIDRPEIVWLMRLLQLLIAGLLVVVSANLAILMYARTVTRLGEIAMRSALGASRGRLLGQLFVEALALSLVGSATGLFLAGLALSWIKAILVPVFHVPYWLAFELSPLTVGYAIALAIVAALIVGVLPGLRTTGGQTHINLRALSGGNRRSLGGLWTTLIVTQVAIASTILPLAIYFSSEVVRMEFSSPAFPAGEFLLAKVDDRDKQREIVSRLEGEPGISAVTFSYGVPGFEGSRRIELDEEGISTSVEVNTLDVDAKLFGAYDARMLAGRGFLSADAGTTAVIVNRTFAEQILKNTKVLGRRFSVPVRAQSGADAAETYEIVGVVDDFPRFPSMPFSHGTRTMYRPAAIGDQRVAVLTIRYRTRITADTIGRLRHVVAGVDPAAPLRDVTLLTEFYRSNRSPWRVMSIGLTLVTVSVLLLSAAGIYALMSFTVARGTREIGIRSALGANPRRLLAGIFGRVLAQLAIGLALGSLLSGALIMTTLEWRDAVVLFGAVAVIILIVGLAAAVGPARRGLAIDPTEALRTDA